MHSFFLGKNPFTTIAGYFVAILTAVNNIGINGGHNWYDYLLPVAIALFGRIAADDKNDTIPPAEQPSISVEQITETFGNPYRQNIGALGSLHLNY